MASFSSAVMAEFEAHATKMRETARARREAVQLRAVVDDHADTVAIDIEDTLGVRMDSDRWQGCTNLRTLRTLLGLVDDRGFERSAHQVRSLASRCRRAAHASLPARADEVPQRVRALRVESRLQARLGHLAPGHHAAQRVEQVQFGGAIAPSALLTTPARIASATAAAASTAAATAQRRSARGATAGDDQVKMRSNQHRYQRTTHARAFPRQHAAAFW